MHAGHPSACSMLAPGHDASTVRSAAGSLPLTIARHRLGVVGSLVRRRIRDFSLAEHAAHLIHRAYSRPSSQFASRRPASSSPSTPLRYSVEATITTSAPTSSSLLRRRQSGCRSTPPATRRASVQQAESSAAAAASLPACSASASAQLASVQIHVGLQEPIEQHQSVRPGLDQPPGHIAAAP